MNTLESINIGNGAAAQFRQGLLVMALSAAFAPIAHAQTDCTGPSVVVATGGNCSFFSTQGKTGPFSFDVEGSIDGIQLHDKDAAASSLVIGTTGALIGPPMDHGIENQGSIEILTNQGLLSGEWSAVFIGDEASITQFTNEGTLTSQNEGIVNFGAIGKLVNTTSGSIAANDYSGIINLNSISELENSGLIYTLSPSEGAIKNTTDSSIPILTNNATGVIAGGLGGIYNSGGIGSLSNAGTIGLLDEGEGRIESTNGVLIEKSGTIGTLSNSGLISGANNGILSAGSIDTITNSGLITGGQGGIYNESSINASASIGSLTNDGLIQGGNGDGISNREGAIIENITNNGWINAFRIGDGSRQAAISNLNSDSGPATIGSIINNNEIVASSDAEFGIYNEGVIGTIENNRYLVGSVEAAIHNNGGTITTIVNSGNIVSAATGIQSVNGGEIVGITNNNGGLIGGGRNFGIEANNSTIGTIANDAGALIIAGSAGIQLENGALMGSLENSGSIGFFDTGEGMAYAETGVHIDGSAASTLLNSGTISGSTYGLHVKNGGQVNSLLNSGNIGINATDVGVAYAATGVRIDASTVDLISNGVNGKMMGSDYGVHNSGTITTLENRGIIRGLSEVGVFNEGVISTLINAQGQNEGGKLTYKGTLPTDYQIVINSPTSYGQLSVTGGLSTTVFGIASGSTVNNLTYDHVIDGLNASSFASLSGDYGRYLWELVYDQTGAHWDLVVNSNTAWRPDAALTLAALEVNAGGLRSAMNLSHAQVGKGLSADCGRFSVSVCFTMNSGITKAGDSSARSVSFAAGYKLNGHSHVGAYYEGGLSGSQAAGISTSKGSVKGLFAGWNENVNGSGLQARANWASGNKNITTLRGGDENVELGSGDSILKSSGISFELRKRMTLAQAGTFSLTPYVGLARTKTTRGAYTEKTVEDVTFPLSYDAVNLSSTTLSTGVRVSKLIEPKITLSGSAGVEFDASRKFSSYSGTSAIEGVESFSSSMGANYRRTRMNLGVGLSYELSPNARVNLGAVMGQGVLGGTTRSVSAGYTLNF